MTPTEHDKKIIRGIEKTLEKSFSYQVLVLNKECRDELMQLITADRKRVELEAKLDELRRMSDLPYIGLRVKRLERLGDRAAELKAQQEEV